jgi:hypothetical protein
MNRLSILRMFLASTALALSCETTVAHTLGSGGPNPLVEIRSLEHALAVADFSVHYFPQQASNFEGLFTNSAVTLSTEISAVLNGAEVHYPSRPSLTGRVQEFMVGKEKWKTDEFRRAANSLASAVIASRGRQFGVESVFDCRHSGRYTIAKIMLVGANGFGQTGPMKFLVNYVNCIDEHYPESYSVERNGRLQLTIHPAADGTRSVTEMEFGSLSGGVGYTVTYTHVPSQTVVSILTSNYSVAGKFVPSRHHEYGLLIEKLSYVINGRVQEWTKVNYIEGEFERVFNLSATALSVEKAGAIDIGGDGEPNTYDDVHRAQTNYRSGYIKATATRAPWDPVAFEVAYSLRNLRIQDEREFLGNSFQSRSVDGIMSYSFPYFANALCANGTYAFNTAQKLIYSPAFYGLETPFSGQQIVNGRAQINYSLDASLGPYAIVRLKDQVGSFYPWGSGIQRCFQ